MKRKRELHYTYAGAHFRILLRCHLVALLMIFVMSLSASDFYPPEVAAQQQREIAGKVTDAQNLPLPGVSVIVKGTAIGTVTNLDGEFSFRIPSNARVLQFSFVGMKTIELPVTDQLSYSVVMAEETVGLEEVVAVGYGVQRKESVVGAITQVDNESLMRSGTTNVTNAIAGKLSGVLTIQQTGEPGVQDSEIIIRGLSSWNSSRPLVLVDGVERDFAGMDPNEINSISVLKDASATAVFGAKGANGVIIVTTKRGTVGAPKFNMSVSSGVSRATRIPDHIDSYTTMSMLNVARMNHQQFSLLTSQSDLAEYKNPSTRLNSLRYPNVDWFSLLTNELAPNSNASLSITGGTDFIKYFASLGYTNEGEFFKSYNSDTRFKYDRYNYRANIDFSLTKITELTFNFGGDLGNRNYPNRFNWRNLYSASPSTFPAYFPAWVLEEVPDPDYPEDSGIRLAASFGQDSANPYSNMYSGSFRRYRTSTLFSDLILDQDLKFMLEGLSFKGKVSFSTSFENLMLYSDYVFPEYVLNYDKIGQPGVNPWFRIGEGNEVYKVPPQNYLVGGMTDNYYRDLYYEMSINYKNSFGDHNVSGLALFNRQQKNNNFQFPYYNEAWVGRTTYNYAYKYLLEVNVGYTGSERFAPGNRFGFFPSGAAGWVLSEEEFFKSAFPWISKFKVRYSDGIVGSDQANERWLYISDFYKDSQGNVLEDKGANLIAQWEEARKRDLGFEIGIFQNTFTLGLDFFDEKRSKMLLEPRTTTFLVGTEFKELNLGRVEKHGLEIEAEYKKTAKSGLHYFVRGIFGYNDSRIIFKDDPPFTPEYLKDAGKPLGAQVNGALLTGTGYFTSVDDLHISAAPISISKLNVGDYKYLDYAADGAITDLDLYPIKGSDYPPITYSMATGFSYKKFDFNVLLQGNEGKYVEFNQIYETEFMLGVLSVHASQLDYWRPDNPTANHATLHYNLGGIIENIFWAGGEATYGYNIRIQDRFWRDASYLRLKEVYAAYNFSSPYFKRLLGIQNFMVYATGNNLFTITNLIEGDPERKDFKRGFYPIMASAKIGLKFNF